MFLHVTVQHPKVQGKGVDVEYRGIASSNKDSENGRMHSVDRNQENALCDRDSRELT